MAEATNKKLTIHPVVDGVIDDNVNIFPNVLLENILENDGQTQANLQKQISIKSGQSNILNLLNNVLSIDINQIYLIFVNKLYPVGSIFMTCDTDLSKNPNDYLSLPGYQLTFNWVPIYDTFLYAAAEGEHTATGDYKVGDVSGFKDAIVPSHTHPITFPRSVTTTLNGNHKHTFSIKNDQGSGTMGSWLSYQEASSSAPTESFTTSEVTKHSHDINFADGSFSIGSVGDPVVGRNMPPYRAVRMWERKED